MASWAVEHAGRFKAACTERACNNLVTMEYTADVAGMTTLLLILHSEQNLRCPVGQAEELFTALRMLGASRSCTVNRAPGRPGGGGRRLTGRGSYDPILIKLLQYPSEQTIADSFAAPTANDGPVRQR
jgi:hypothetical protein